MRLTQIVDDAWGDAFRKVCIEEGLRASEVFMTLARHYLGSDEASIRAGLRALSDLPKFTPYNERRGFDQKK